MNNFKWYKFLFEQHTKSVKFSPRIVQFIKKMEGFREKPYKDSGGIWTIGFGTTILPDGSRVNQNTPMIDSMTGEKYLEAGMSEALLRINRLVKRDLNQNQLDALVSFVYTVGSGNFERSELLKKINANPNDPSIKDEFIKFTRDADGHELPGAEIRRAHEAELYFTEDPNEKYTSSPSVPVTQYKIPTDDMVLSSEYPKMGKTMKPGAKSVKKVVKK